MKIIYSILILVCISSLSFAQAENDSYKIAKSKHKAVFQPGYTTKDRGWGLGLSLSKRIIEEYHDGKIFVKHSDLGRGTTFRILIKKS